MRIAYTRRLNLRSWKLGMLGVIALGVLSACGSNVMPAERGSVSTGTTRQAGTEMPTIGAEIGTDTVVPVAANVGYNTELATDGSGFLAVQTIGGLVRGSRLDAAGQVLDLNWIDFGPGSTPTAAGLSVNQYYPSASFGAGHYLVAWVESESDGQGSSQPRGLRGRLVGPDGRLVGAQNIQIGGNSSALYPASVWDGQHFVVVWSAPDGNGQYNVFLALLNTDGTPLAGSERQVSTRGNATNPRIGHGAGHTFLAWEEYSVSSEGLTTGYAVWGTRISASGEPLDAGGAQLSGPSTSELSADIAVSDTDTLVVFQTMDSPYRVRGTLVPHGGEIGSRDFAISHSTGDAGQPSVAFDGSNYLVSWADSREERPAVYGIKVAPGGAPLSSSDVRLSTGAPRSVGFGSDHTNIAWNGSRYLVTFLADGILGNLIEKDLTPVTGPIPVTAIPNPQGYPASVWDGQNYAVSWTDERNGNTNMSLRAVRIDTQGKLLDPDGIAVSPPENPAFSHSFSSMGDGSTLFAWSDSADGPKQRMLSSAGALGPVVSFSAEHLMTVPALVSDGTQFLAVFGTGDSSNGQVFGRWLDATGAPGSQFKLSATTFNTAPWAFRAESGFWVTYAQAGTWVLPVSSSGQAGTALKISDRSVWLNGAGGESNALVLWSEPESPVVRARFLKGGAFSGQPFEVISHSLGYGAVAAWDGSTYWVVWETDKHYLEGRSLSADGTLGEVSTWVDGNCAGPTLASNGHGQLLLSYVKHMDDSLSRRVYSRLVGSGVSAPDGGAGGAGAAAGGAGGTGTSTGVAGAASPGEPGTGGANTSGNNAEAGAVGVAGGSNPTHPVNDAGSSGASVGRDGSTGSGGSTNLSADAGEAPTASVQCNVSQTGHGPGSRGAAAGVAMGLAALAMRRRREQGRAEK